MKRICKIASVLVVVAMYVSLCFAIASCSVETLKQLVSDYGITLEGGGFEKGSSLVTDIIETTGEKGKGIVALLEKQEYVKDGNMSIFDIFVAKDGNEVQPNGKVKVTIPAPFESENGYVTFHIKDDDTVETLETTYEEGKISFETESFSCFVVAESEKYYTLSLINDSGSGKMSLDGFEQEYNKKAAINSGRTEGSESVLVATETSEDYAFIGWYGSSDTSDVWDIKYDNLLSTEKTFTFTMPAYDYIVYAVFRPVQDYYTLGVINVDGRGSISLDEVEYSWEGGISSGRAAGAESVLVATETSEDYAFFGWYGTMDTSNVWALKYEVLLSAEKTFTFTMPAYDYIIYAVFKPAHTVYAFADKDAEGTITWGENNESAAAEVKVAEGKSVTLTAVPKEGYRFLGWYDEPKNENEQIGNLLCENAAYTVNVDDSDVNIYARFEKIPEPVTEEYPLTVGQQGAGGCVSINGDTASSPESSPYYENYAAGERIMLVAQTRSSEYIFKGWFEIDDTTLTHLVLKDTPVSTQLTYSFDMPENGYTVYAVFEAVVTSLSLDGANAGFSGGTATYTIGDEYKPNPENVVVSGVTAEGNLFLTAGVDYSIDLGGLNFEVAGVYTVT
ncbi:MAG: InlB B-repeat-containing protein, partial [Candidatus Scatosoma sp.]